MPLDQNDHIRIRRVYTPQRLMTEWCHVCRRSRTTRWHDNAAEAEYHQLEERAGALLDKFKREDTTKMEGTKP